MERFDPVPRSLTLRLTDEQRMAWSDAAVRLKKPLRAFLVWAADFAARYTFEEFLQELHRQRDPVLARLEEKKRLRAVMDAAWHALDFLPPPSEYPLSGAIRDPKGDLRKALEALYAYLDEIQEEYKK